MDGCNLIDLERQNHYYFMATLLYLCHLMSEAKFEIAYWPKFERRQPPDTLRLLVHFSA